MNQNKQNEEGVLILNSFISWVGGKKALRQELYRLFPKNYGRYIEVFGGGGWVLFGKPQDHCSMEVYNDYNNDLANLFLCTRDKGLSVNTDFKSSYSKTSISRRPPCFSAEVILSDMLVFSFVILF